MTTCVHVAEKRTDMADDVARVAVQLRLDDTIRLQLCDHMSSAEPFPPLCAFRASTTFGQVHAYVRQQLLAAITQRRGSAQQEDIARHAHSVLPVTFLDVSSGGTEVVPAPETCLSSILQVVGQRRLGAADEGVDLLPAISINVRAQVFSG